MPVFGLFKDQRAGTYLLRPPSVISAGGCGFGKLKDGNCAANICGDSRYGDAVDNRTTAKEKFDPNILIAAYGTQITLHKCRPGSAGDLQKHSYSPGKYSSRAKTPIHIPTGALGGRCASIQRQRTSNKPKRIDSLITSVNRNQTMQRAKTQFNNSCLMEEENKKKFSEISERFCSKSSSSITLAYTSKDLHQTSAFQKSLSSHDTTDSCEETVDLIHYNSTMTSPRGDYKRTAWHSSQSGVCPSSTVSVANCVDFNDVAKIVASKYSRLTLEPPKAPASSAVDEIEIKTPNSSTDSSVTEVGLRMGVRIPTQSASVEEQMHSEDIYKEVDRRADNADPDKLDDHDVTRHLMKRDDFRENASSLQSYVNRMKVISKLQAFRFPNENGKNEFPNCKIKEVWGARNKTPALGNLGFSHENLRRPSSAAQLTHSYSIPSSGANDIRGITSEVFSHACSGSKCFDAKRRTSSGKRRKKTRRKIRTSASNTTECNGHSLQSSSTSLLERETSSGVLDSKSLIRQSHRPTTAIRYCQQDDGTRSSITPCLRKAVVSHSVYVSMHNHMPSNDAKLQSVSQTNSSDPPDFTVLVRPCSALKQTTTNQSGSSDKTKMKTEEITINDKESAVMEKEEDIELGSNEIENPCVLQETTGDDVAAKRQPITVTTSAQDICKLPDHDGLQSSITNSKISISDIADDVTKNFSHTNNAKELKNKTVQSKILPEEGCAKNKFSIPYSNDSEKSIANPSQTTGEKADQLKPVNRNKNNSDAISRPIIPRIAPLSKFRLRRFDCRSLNQENSNCFKMMKDRMIRKWLIKVEDARCNPEFIADDTLS